MPETPEQRIDQIITEKGEEIIDALVALGLQERQDEVSWEKIRQICQCTLPEAKAILNRLYVERRLIEATSPDGGELPAGGRIPNIPNGRWRWKRVGPGRDTIYSGSPVHYADVDGLSLRVGIHVNYGSSWTVVIQENGAIRWNNHGRPLLSTFNEMGAKEVALCEAANILDKSREELNVVWRCQEPRQGD